VTVRLVGVLSHFIYIIVVVVVVVVVVLVVKQRDSVLNINYF
jgi:hypothetical protein